MTWKLYEADCFDIFPEIEDKSIDMVITDPPYNINFIPQRKTNSNKLYARQGISNDNLSDNDFSKWLDELCFELNRVLKDDSYLFMFSGWPTIYLFQPILMKYFNVKSICIWAKNNFGIGYYVRPQYEPFFMCLKGKPEKPKKAHSDLWFYNKCYPTNDEPVHSCQKPTDLIEDIINFYGVNSTLILDPFGGSGTTGVACQNLNRDCILIEKEAEYCQIIRERMQTVETLQVEQRKQQTLLDYAVAK